MAPSIRKKKRNELARVCEALYKGENLLSIEDVHFIQTCCQIMKTSESNKVKFIATTVVTEGEGNPGLTIAIVKKLLEALGSDAETFTRDFLAPYQTTRNMDNIDSHAWFSLEYLTESTRSLQEALQVFKMGIRMARFNMTKSMEDYKVTVERVAMAAKFDENLMFAWIC
jgi:hypothetical protein